MGPMALPAMLPTQVLDEVLLAGLLPIAKAARVGH